MQYFSNDVFYVKYLGSMAIGSCSGATTGPTDTASGGGGKIGFTCGKFFANLAKVLAKICVCARNYALFRFSPGLWNFYQKSMIKRSYYMHFVCHSQGAAILASRRGAAKPNVLPLMAGFHNSTCILHYTLIKMFRKFHV